MNERYNQVVLIGHLLEKLIYSIDKEPVHKITFITEKEPLSGTPEAKRILNKLNDYYKERKILVQNVEFDFHVQTKPIAELTHLIYQQKLQGFSNIKVNISGGLRYMVIWLYIACSITNTKIIHGDFIYEGSKEVGIYDNMELPTIPFQVITDKQLEFLGLFFNPYTSPNDFFNPDLSFNDNQLLNNRKKYTSLEILKEKLEKKRGNSLSRGSINGFIQKLKRLSALNIFPNPKDKKEKTIGISYIGIAYFLHKLFTEKNLRKSSQK
ncbi:hypothetical protein LCGC14_1041890 [marine sediment metagenome]|uniref:CRISPR system ring nuclease SSO1393-like domain-containing protein n=1 Tax=marine sediment metagenome TaxID=412755 RepID=A0A0F9MRE7_9ZZZZ